MLLHEYLNEMSKVTESEREIDRKLLASRGWKKRCWINPDGSHVEMWEQPVTGHRTYRKLAVSLEVTKMRNEVHTQGVQPSSPKRPSGSHMHREAEQVRKFVHPRSGRNKRASDS